MTISNDYTFNSTRTDIIKDAFAELNIFGIDQNIDSESYNHANRLLNRMVKTWMSQGYHLWLKEIAYLFLRLEQNTYRLSSSSLDHATLEYFNTKVSSNAVIGSNSITVDDISGINQNDYIGIIISGNDLFWTTVSSITGNIINFPIGVSLTSEAIKGNNVYTYKNKLSKPLEIYSAVRNYQNRDIPMDYFSYEEWFELPNKTGDSSTPVSFSYDKQLNEAIIRLWPSPSDCNVIIKFVISREISNFDVNSNTPDFPQEWHEAIYLNLAVRLAFPYRKSNDNAYQNLSLLAEKTLNNALGFDNEQNSMYIKPNFRQ